MKKLLLTGIMSMIFLSIATAQEVLPDKETEGGKLMLGMRSTISAFSDESSSGIGAGGQFRIRLLKQVNTEWFADYIKSDIGEFARRTDAHIGWSVMFYTLDQDKSYILNPYLLAGHCFDYTKVAKHYSNDMLDRWSSAVHLGAGTHFPIGKKADLSLSTQYMLHLGKDINTEEYKNTAGDDDLRIYEGDLGLEGHLFISLSVNVQLADLW